MKKILIVHYQAIPSLQKIISASTEFGASIRIICGMNPYLSNVARKIADELGVSYLPTPYLDNDDIADFDHEGLALIERTGMDLLIIVSKLNFCSIARFFAYEKILKKDFAITHLFPNGGICEIDLRSGEEKFL